MNEVNKEIIDKAGEIIKKNTGKETYCALALMNLLIISVE